MTERDNWGNCDANGNGFWKGLWAGRIIAALCILFLLVDAGVKLLNLTPVVEGTVRLGYAASVLPALGTILLISTTAYAIPRTSVLGVILLISVARPRRTCASRSHSTFQL